MPNPTSPLDEKRVSQVLDSAQINYYLDPQGEIGTVWENAQIYFRLLGEDNNILQILGMIEPVEEKDTDVDRLVWFANSWNSETPWPKAVVLFEGEGEDTKVQLRGEQTFVYVDGVSDPQLAADISGMVGPMNDLFDRYVAEVRGI